MKTFLLSLTVVLAVVPATRVAAAEAARPNILYFYVDDILIGDALYAILGNAFREMIRIIQGVKGIDSMHAILVNRAALSLACFGLCTLAESSGKPLMIGVCERKTTP